MNANALLGRLQQPISAELAQAAVAYFPPSTVRRVAVCDDDLPFIRYVERALQIVDVEVTPITTLALDEAVAVLASSGCDAALVDLHMYNDQAAGFRLVEYVRADPVIARLPLYLATGDVRAAQRHRDLLSAHRCNLLLKPFGVDELLSALRLESRVQAA